MKLFLVKAGTPIKVIKKFDTWANPAHFIDKVTKREEHFNLEEILIDPLRPSLTSKYHGEWARKGWYGFRLGRFKNPDNWFVMLVDAVHVGIL